MELQGGKPKTITVAIPKAIAYIYKNLKDICDSVLCIYHKWLCTLFRCASLWDRALSPINISLISCLGGPLFLSVTSSPSQASERRWFQLGQFPQHTGGCFPAMVHRCPQWGGVRHPRVVQLIWSKPSITTWFCGSRVCFSMSVLHTQSLKLKQILYWLHDGWWCFLRSYKPLAPLQTRESLSAHRQQGWSWGEPVVPQPRVLPVPETPQEGAARALMDWWRNLSVEMLLFLSLVSQQIIFFSFPVY